ncbi:MAG TPA: SEC-C metal-binding domain-containing protein [Myxococcota bacterium]|nr:SEC-C metal-binding domain-containing protein [Myxococcota bacterium]
MQVALLAALGDEALSDAGRASVEALGEGAVPALVAILEDRQLWEEDAPGGGWAPIHAAQVLGERRAADAIPALIEALRHLGDDDLLATAAIVALSKMGATAAAAAYALHQQATSPFLRSAACTIIARSGAREPRYLALLRALLDEDPGWGAACLAMYGDATALGPLSEALERSNAAVANDIAVAIEALGARLSEAQRGIVALAHRPRGAAQLGHTMPKIGRNDPCPCGSHKKYKKCHGAP